MNPCARLSRLGLPTALVAGLVVICFLATHASAAVGDPCAGVDCGVEASCAGLSPTETFCDCHQEDLVFNEADKTCYAPVVRTTVGLQARGYGPMADLTFLTTLPATTVCGRLGLPVTNIAVSWNASKPCAWHIGSPSLCVAANNAMCSSLTFYSAPDCTKKPAFTIARPAREGNFYPLTTRTVKGIKSLGSVACKITMCENDCGTAECVQKEGQWQCQCPEGLVFNAAKKLCHAAPPRTCLVVCCVLFNKDELARHVLVGADGDGTEVEATACGCT
ncbi:unnamed protein product [Closterium sp. Yama58-4]|nr:unnamed protein product [Closterium sp. Yama58-4]